MAGKRVEVSITTKRQVLTEAGCRCAVPTCRNILAIDTHHIIQVSGDGGNEVGNLIALCGACHDLYDRGEITGDAIRDWKGILVALNYAFDSESVDNLIFLRTLRPNQLLVSGDGVLKFSQLIAAGLAAFVLRARDGLSFLYDVQLTPNGRMLVEAWFTGDRIVVQDAITGPHNT